jgi:hypothetical protein
LAMPLYILTRKQKLLLTHETPPELLFDSKLTHFLLGFPFPQVTEFKLPAGRLPFFFAFLVVKVTPSPPGPGRTPTAFSLTKPA